jgi:hypothetical protein
MIYFLPWVVFLALVVLSVPNAAWLEKRKLRAAFPERFESESELDEGEGDVGEEVDNGEADGAEAEGAEADVVFEDSANFADEGAEDLSAFDDFK